MNGTGFHAGHNLHIDFGNVYDGKLWGMPINEVNAATPRVPVTFKPNSYESESDPIPAEGLPIPHDVKVEGDLPNGSHDWPNPGADHHMILLETDTGILHELYLENLTPQGWVTKQYSRWDTKTNNMRPLGWTTTDVAGLPLAPLLVRFDEAASGYIGHALRFTVDLSWGLVWPARHPGTSGGQQNPPMGTRVRLKPGIPIDIFHGSDIVTLPAERAVLRCMQEFGMILADHAGDWFVQGAHDPRWSDRTQFRGDLFVYLLPADCFEVVDQDALKLASDSMQARQ